MKIETILTPAELPALARRDLRQSTCVVFDVLRATSTFVTALHHGAKAIIPVSEIAEAIAFKKAERGKQKGETILLGGERNSVRISADGIDFNLGNSPREYTPEKVRGKTIISTTTNGTRALRACAGVQTNLAASFLNLKATAKFLRENNFQSILLVCAGTGENQADEDVLAAGALCDLLFDEPLTPNLPPLGRGEGVDDSTQIARRAWLAAKPDLLGAVRKAENARRLLAIPELYDDVTFCLQRDIFPLVARLEADGAIRVIKNTL